VVRIRLRNHQEHWNERLNSYQKLRDCLIRVAKADKNVRFVLFSSVNPFPPSHRFHVFVRLEDKRVYKYSMELSPLLINDFTDERLESFIKEEVQEGAKYASSL
jgi:hypothetical protein